MHLSTRKGFIVIGFSPFEGCLPRYAKLRTDIACIHSVMQIFLRESFPDRQQISHDIASPESPPVACCSEAIRATCSLNCATDLRLKISSSLQLPARNMRERSSRNLSPFPHETSWTNARPCVSSTRRRLTCRNFCVPLRNCCRF